MTMGKTLRVTIFGRHYSLRPTEENSEELIRRVATMVEERMEQIASEMPGQSELSIAILVAMELAEDYIRAAESPQPEPSDFSEEIETLTRILQNALQNDSGDGTDGQPSVSITDSETA